MDEQFYVKLKLITHRVWMQIIVKNIPLIGGLPIILAILPNDNWFLLATDSIIDSFFFHFMK